MNRLIISAAAAFATLGSASICAADPILRIENAAARVVVIPEGRADVIYTVTPGRAALPPLRNRRDGGVVVLDGGLNTGFAPFGLRHDLSCQGSGDHARVRIAGHGDVPLQDLPLITARVPLNARIAVGSAVFGEVGPTEALDLGVGGCGDWKVADVRGALRLQLSGSGDVHGGSVGGANVSIAGAGDVYLGAVGSLDTKVTGSGNLHAAAVNGPLKAKISGSGDISIDGGRSPNLFVSIVGSGDLRYRGTAAALSAFIAGSGDIDVAHVTGAVNKHVVGSGDVNFGR